MRYLPPAEKKKYLDSIHPAVRTAGEGPASWFVLTTTNPRQAENCIVGQNVDDEKSGRPRSFRAFIPYTYMEVAPTQDEERREHLSLRAALHRYLFVQGDAQKLSSLLSTWNGTSADKIYHLLDSDRQKARISDSAMNRLMEACTTDRPLLDVSDSLRDVQVGQEFVPANSPMGDAGSTYTVVGIRRKSGGIVELQLSTTLFGVEFRNLFVTYRDEQAGSRNIDMVFSTQCRVLDIFRRRVNRKETEATRYDDRRTLESLFARRGTPLPDGPMSRHFLALMLICSQLLGLEEERKELIAEAESQLAAIARHRESKAATDTRAWLHVALYVATGEPTWRDQAKTYVQKYHPRSPYLCQMVTTSCKFGARKFLGKRP